LVAKGLAGAALGGGGVAGAATRAHHVGSIVTQGSSASDIDVCETIHSLPVSTIFFGEHDGGAQGSDDEECDSHGVESHWVE